MSRAVRDAVVDALLWIKRPGESDGTWWRDHAIGLAQRAAWWPEREESAPKGALLAKLQPGIGLRRLSLRRPRRSSR